MGRSVTERTDDSKPCRRCGGVVNAEMARKRLSDFGIIFCTDCKGDKVWLKAVTTKG